MSSDPQPPNSPPKPPSDLPSDQPEQNSDSLRFPVVGVGASAGGLEAFTQLLSHLPSDTGMAFVLVQHLDPRQGSLLSEIMARTTPMPVHEVQHGMVIKPNQVYVIPPGTIMTLAAGRLQLRPRGSSPISRAIDSLFESLAEERGNRAIGIVLSGADADGTLGLEAIKAAGGVTFAQTEASAQFRDMPHMAIASGQIDFVLSPAAIAQTLVSISRHPYVAGGDSSASAIAGVGDEAFMNSIIDQLKAAKKVDFTGYKPTTLTRRIFRRMAVHRFDQIQQYDQYLQRHPEEVEVLYQEILISVTNFFRDGEAYECLKSEILPTLFRNRSLDSPLRVWVAGCSSGEEAYSIAICLLEFLASWPHPTPSSVQIFATDVNEQMIDIARRGVYLPSKVADVSAERLQRFFLEVEGGYQVSKVVREMCIFARQNLISDPPFSQLDLISCRNVLIYFRSSLQKRGLTTFHYGLKPRGFLWMGSSESVGELTDLFSLFNREHKIYAKQPLATRLSIDLLDSQYAFQPTILHASYSPERLQAADLFSLADQTLIDHYSPVGVLVNHQLEILQFRGQTGTYLEPSPGRASLNLLNMARGILAFEVRTLTYQAQQEGRTVRKDNIFFQDDNVLRQVAIEVVPFTPRTSGDCYFWVLFADLETPQPPAGPAELPQAEDADLSEQDQELSQLRQELTKTRSQLQAIIEEKEAANQDLRAANEEILSSNEELQSTNEELQTAKEEIQATNEELRTINEELYERNAETIRISNDFQNLLNNINLPILMLDRDLSIRRFTPAATNLFNLISTDVGRPLGDINHKLLITELESAILGVIDTLNQYSQDLQDMDGRWYNLRIRPYRTLDDRIDGAVVVLIDVDDLKRQQRQLQDSRSYIEAMIRIIQHAFVIINGNFRVVRANQPFYDLFQVTPQETEATPFFELGNGQWDIPPLRSLLNELAQNNTTIDNFQLDHEFAPIERKQLQINACQLPQGSGENLILLSIEDITHRPS